MAEENRERKKLLEELEKKKLFSVFGLEIMRWDEVSLHGFLLVWAIVFFLITGVKILANLGGESVAPGWYAGFILTIALIAVFSLTTARSVRRQRKESSSGQSAGRSAGLSR